jgi:hypothetical protein
MRLLEVARMQARTPRERELEKERGPMYHIIYSLNRYKEACDERDELFDQHKRTVRVKMIPSKREFEAIAQGNFDVYEISDDAPVVGSE